MEHYHAKRLYIGTTAERTTLGGTFGTESIGVRFWDTDTGEEYVWSGAAWIASPAHNLLSATHTDTVVNAPTRGSLVYGDATPDWDELVLGADGAALISDGTDMAWDLTPTWKGVHTHEANIVLDDGVSDSPMIQFIGGSNDDVAQIYLDDDGAAGRSDLIVQLCDDAGESKLYLKNLSGNPVWTVDSDGNVVMADGTTIGQAAGPLLTFDDTNNYLEITGCKVGIDEATPGEKLSVTGHVIVEGLDGFNAMGEIAALKFGHANQSDAVLGMVGVYGTGFVICAWQAAGGGYLGVDSMNVTTFEQNTGNVYPGSNKTQDLGLSGTAWDDCWADDFQNEPDYYFLDERRDERGKIVPVDDLAIICGIQPSGEFDGRTGLPLVDDSSIPEWVFTRDKHTGETLYDPDGKPWLSLKMTTSLTWGAIRQLVERLEKLEAI